MALLFTRGVASDAEAATLRRGRLMDEWSGRLGLAVDVLDVERLAPITFATVFKSARLILDRDPIRRIDVLARQYAIWHDMQPHYRLQRAAVEAHFGVGAAAPRNRE